MTVQSHHALGRTRQHGWSMGRRVSAGPACMLTACQCAPTCNSSSLGCCAALARTHHLHLCLGLGLIQHDTDSMLCVLVVLSLETSAACASQSVSDPVCNSVWHVGHQTQCADAAEAVLADRCCSWCFVLERGFPACPSGCYYSPRPLRMPLPLPLPGLVPLLLRCPYRSL